jgi:hypothetical protein
LQAWRRCLHEASVFGCTPKRASPQRPAILRGKDSVKVHPASRLLGYY